MRPQSLVQTASLLSMQQEPARSVPTGSFREAHHQLRRMFAERQPLALLHSEVQSSTRYLIDLFLAGNADDVAVIRLKEPCRDEVSGMSEIIRGIGFDPADLSLNDLENVFELFLSFQRKHGCRTILCIEATHECGRWVLNTVRRIVRLEAAEQHGLMVVMTGHSNSDAVLGQSMLDAVSTRAEQCIYLASFTLAETREFLRWQVESEGKAKIAKVLEFDAITRIHELTEGEPDAVSGLFSRCLQLASEKDPAPVSVDLVDRASNELRPSSVPFPELVEKNILPVSQVGPSGGRLLVRLSDDVVQEYSLDRGHVLIGRGKLCDVRIESPAVSRHHALVIRSPAGAVLVDLESTNGTFVDGEQVKEHVLAASGVVTMGDCNIEFVGDDERQDCFLDVRSAEQLEPYDAHSETQKLHTFDRDCGNGHSTASDGKPIKGNINRKGEKIYHIPGASKYDATKIDESKGERWFCSEDEAIAAGWRASRN